MTTTTYGVDHYYMDPNGCLVFYETSPNCIVTPPPPPPPPLPSGIIPTPTPYSGLLSYLSAVPLNYEQVLVKWQEPQTAYLDWRLVRSRYGFPVDQNDGVVLEDTDSSSFPGFQYLDSGVIPGTYNYYAIYLLVASDWPAWESATTYAADAVVSYGGYIYVSNITSNTDNEPSGTTANNTQWDYLGENEVWYRSGFAACLCPWNYNSASWIKGRLPNYFVNWPSENLTTSDPIGNHVLNQYLNVIGWGIDYLKTTCFVAENVNNPAVVPENWLYLLANELGMPFEPEISTGVLRGAVANQSTLIKQRGTLEGIEAYITALTGWAADIRPGTNQMLEDDQSMFTDPVLAAWSSSINYATGQMVSYEDYLYISLVDDNLDVAPSGTTTANANWDCLYYSANATILANTVTDWINTWEPRQLGASNDVPVSSSALTEAIGILDQDDNNFLSNGLIVTNPSNSAATMDLQSISRSAADITAGLTYASRTQVIGDGIPVPYTIPQQAWSSTVQYPTGAVVTYNSQPFLALKSSMNVTPPTNSVPTKEWQPLGYDERIALMMSGYSIMAPGAAQLDIQPYVAWYDQYGNHIVNLYPRNTASAPLADTYPPNLMFQSFAQQWGTALTGTTPDVGNYAWTAQASTFTVNGYEGGCIYPSATSTRTLALVTFAGETSLELGYTFLTLPASGYSMGPVIRWAISGSTESYWRIDQNAIYEVNGTTHTKQGSNHTTLFAAGDRMIVMVNGNTLTVYRYNAPTISSPVNLAQVNTCSISALNTSSVTHGVIVEAT